MLHQYSHRTLSLVCRSHPKHSCSMTSSTSHEGMLFMQRGRQVLQDWNLRTLYAHAVCMQSISCEYDSAAMIVMILLRYSHSFGLCAHKSLARCSRQIASLGWLVKVILSTGVRLSDSCLRCHLNLMMNVGPTITFAY